MVMPNVFVPEVDGFEYYKKLLRTKNDPNYQILLNSTRVVGVWDDHDYGLNNGGIDFKYKDRNQQFFLDFLDEPKFSPRRARKGIYEAYYIGEPKLVKVLLLDVRYSNNHMTGDVLGQEQWNWLDEQLSEYSPLLYVIASGMQIIPDNKPGAETWPAESKQKLYELIKKNEASVLLLSGDIHQSEFLTHPCSQKLVGYDLVEFTSSGLTMGFGHGLPVIGELFNTLIDDTYSTSKDRYQEKNYGIIEIELNENKLSESIITLNQHGLNTLNKPIQQRKYQLKDFQKKLVLKDESSCVLNDGSTNIERMINHIPKSLYKEIIVNKHYDQGVIILAILGGITFVLWFYCWLFKIITGIYKLRDEKKARKPKQKKQ
ncbi:hypothetical protein PPERSA_10834 [Pseudocohnilembus persalinus]|uniref:PhoD-like phosphatase metallophosphatase domain-containing protein n=1 Tax=Pseudocohnilembus persalinus TaxID=266149 RepID=A0A0V0QDN8_PSEPJ|nr:hypothetical protein PPERSA_10834 [Pseudocohnilembus persalinus]|eukprot:KRX00335.1 hypothetical protein PPERSA_10834 [Pseudocohnilembus persalinus]